MPKHSTEISTTARYAELPGLMRHLGQQASLLGISATAIPRLHLILEELFSNSIEHGYGQECAQPVSISLQTHGSGVTLIYRDQAAPFDINQRSVRTPDEESLGGFGINLVLGMADAVRCRWEAGSNITEVDL